MNVTRLRWVLEHLENDERWTTDVFDINVFVMQKPLDPCGTVCCAVGSLMGDSRAEEAGLTFPPGWDGVAIPTYEGMEGIYAISSFFAISVDLARHLFFFGGYKTNPTRRQVTDRILTVIKANTSVDPNIERLGWIVENLKNEEKWEKTYFDMRNWVVELAKPGRRRQFESVPPECGTVCCAFGSLRGDPRAEEAGLKFGYGSGFEDNARLMPVYNDGLDGDAVKTFLNIKHGLSEWLFYPYNYPQKHTREMVIDRIETVIEMARTRQ